MNYPPMTLEAVYETTGGRELARRSNGHGDPRDLERYYSPGGELEIRCSTTEREDFESETTLAITSDVLAAGQFKHLFRWLTENARLRLFGFFTRANIAYEQEQPTSKPMKPRIELRLNLSVVLDPRLTRRDVITGTLPGNDKLEIVVARRWKGWTPLLRITLAGHVLHFGEASESDRQQFEELHCRAVSARFRDDESLSDERLLQAAKDAKLWIESLV